MWAEINLCLIVIFINAISCIGWARRWMQIGEWSLTALLVLTSSSMIIAREWSTISDIAVQYHPGLVVYLTYLFWGVYPPNLLGMIREVLA